MFPAEDEREGGGREGQFFLHCSLLVLQHLRADTRKLSLSFLIEGHDNARGVVQLNLSNS